MPLKRSSSFVLALLVASGLQLAAVAATGSPSPAPTVPPIDPTQVGNWLGANWVTLGTMLGSVFGIYTAVRQSQWDQLVKLAGDLAFNVATLSGLDDAAKRKQVEDRLYANAGPMAHLLFSQEKFELAIEMGYQLIAKPKTAAPKTAA